MAQRLVRCLSEMPSVL